jgi:hypothetical protein
MKQILIVLAAIALVMLVAMAMQRGRTRAHQVPQAAQPFRP